MAVDHDRARELQARGDRLRELLDGCDLDTGLIRSLGVAAALDGSSVYIDPVDARELQEAAAWIDAVVAAWERQER